jgi:SAM-dependent methyltransferase
MRRGGHSSIRAAWSAVNSLQRKIRMVVGVENSYRAVMAGEREYILGTHNEEIARLALQHRVWRSAARVAWHRGGFRTGHTLIDVGSGPGNATFDLAELAGPNGAVIALEKSRRFLDVLESHARERDVHTITAVEIDLDREPLPEFVADGAWCRWALSFITSPRALLATLGDRLRPGGALVVHEYFDYATWRAAPPSAELEEFVRLVMRSWRESGGEPDLGLVLPQWCAEVGFKVRDVRPIVEATAPGEPKWQWLAAFLESGSKRLESLGTIRRDQGEAIRSAVGRLAANPGTRMITPGLFEIIAVKR